MHEIELCMETLLSSCLFVKIGGSAITNEMLVRSCRASFLGSLG